MRFADIFPDNCPPNDCISCEGVFYYFVVGEIDDPNNFIPYALQGKGTDCVAHGLSMLRTLEAAEIYRGMPNLKKKNLAKGTLTPDCGKLKNTPTKKSQDHYTLWVYEGIQISKYFEIIRES